jgi:hypothetical protein
VDRSAFDERLASLRESRFRLPEIVRNRLQSRHRRPLAGHSGRLLLIEADDPARGLLGVDGDPLALADRGELLFRLHTALAGRGVDGVIGTADIVDDLLLLEALEDKLALGSMNRGGLPGSVFERDAPFTGYDAETIVNAHLDGGVMRLFIDPADRSTARVVEECARNVTALALGGVMALVAPAWGGVDAAGRPDESAEGLIRAMDVAAGLGGRSPFTWLALPAGRVDAGIAAATTLPILLTASSDAGAAAMTTEHWQSVLALPGVRGAVVPAAALYGGDGGAEMMVQAWADLVHGPMTERERR